METLTIPFPKIQIKTFNLSISKNALNATVETTAAVIFLAAVFVWLLV